MRTAAAGPLVLLIEDDEECRLGLVAVLQAHGYPVVALASAAMALSLLRSGAVEPSVILLDLMMRGMTGWQFRTEQLRDNGISAIPVIYVSAFPFTLDTLQSGPSRAVAALRKPVRPAELIQLIASVVGSPPSSPPPPAGGNAGPFVGPSGLDAAASAF